MKITLPTTYDEKYTEGLAEINSTASSSSPKIKEVYGSLQSSILASARPSKYLPSPDFNKIKTHIEELKSVGIEFSYLVNAPCLGNIEYSAEGRREIEELLQKLSDCGIERMVITIPYLMEIVREKFPHIEICASSICYISNIKMAKRFESLGVKRIIVDPDKNRNFKFLQKLSNSVNCDIEIIANHTCIHHCTYEFYHYNNTGHGSQKTYFMNEKPYNQYNLLSCTLKKLESPWEFLASPWIPPTDIDILRDVGIKWIKLAGRGSSSETLLKLADAYVNKRHSNDLISLLGWCHWNNFRKTADNQILPEMKIYLDSKRLNGFIMHFLKEYKCDDGCNSCSHCKVYAKKALSYDEKLLELYKKNLREKLNSLIEEKTNESLPKAKKHLKIIS
ncbi:MAG: hypothetical protein D6734_06115 [Candidatus Schekmanbacteria bacterium]|nr:MAG: hypothetical protein D6734_06115 [Candidatus Schekmanbacteria bacterium]